MCKLAAVLGNLIFGSLVGITKAIPILLASSVLVGGGLVGLRLPDTRANVLMWTRLTARCLPGVCPVSRITSQSRRSIFFLFLFEYHCSKLSAVIPPHYLLFDEWCRTCSQTQDDWLCYCRLKCPVNNLGFMKRSLALRRADVESLKATAIVLEKKRSRWMMRPCENKSGSVSGDQTLDIFSSASYSGCSTHTAHK